MAKKAKTKKSTATKSQIVRAKLSEVARLFEVIARNPTATSDFIKAADERDAVIKLDESTKRFVRRFLSTKGMLKSPAAAKKTTTAMAMVTAAPKDIFTCF